MKTPSAWFLSAAVVLASATIAEAQVVQLGPGSIRAPYVRAYRSPRGTVVVAPYMRLDVGAPSRRADLVAPSSRGTLRSRDAARTPGRRIYVSPYGIQRIVIPRPTSPSTSNASQLLSADLPMVERQRQLLARSAQQLYDDLQRMRGGAAWQTYLQMPTGVTSTQHRTGSKEVIQPDASAVDAVLAKFDFVVSREDYRALYQLPAFRTTHRLLREYVVLLSLPSTEELEEAARVQPTPVIPNGTSPAIPVPVSQQPAEELPTPQTDPR